MEKLMEIRYDQHFISSNEFHVFCGRLLEVTEKEMKPETSLDRMRMSDSLNSRCRHQICKLKMRTNEFQYWLKPPPLQYRQTIRLQVLDESISHFAKDRPELQLCKLLFN